MPRLRVWRFPNPCDEYTPETVLNRDLGGVFNQEAAGLCRDHAKDNPLTRFVIDDLPLFHRTTIAEAPDSACTLAA